MSDSDGKLPEISMEPITENGPSSESGSEENTKYRRSHLGSHECKTFAFIGGEKPHFLFSCEAGWGRFYVTDTQIALCIEDCSRHIGNIVRAKSGERS